MESDGIGEVPHDLLLETYGAQGCVTDWCVLLQRSLICFLPSEYVCLAYGHTTYIFWKHRWAPVVLLSVIEQTSPFIPLPSPTGAGFDLHRPVEFSKCEWTEALSVLIGALASLAPLSVHGKKGSWWPLAGQLGSHTYGAVQPPQLQRTNQSPQGVRRSLLLPLGLGWLVTQHHCRCSWGIHQPIETLF